MKKLILLSFLVSVIFIGCKDESDINICDFHQPDHQVEQQPHMLCADCCYFTYELFGQQYTYSSTDLRNSESVNCISVNDSCSHVMENVWVDESFKFAAQRFEDSIQFLQSFNKKLPLRLYDSLLWGQKYTSASFELIDQCNNRHFITNAGFPEKNNVVFDSAVFIEEHITSTVRVYHYTLKGSFSSKILDEENSNNMNGIYDVNGQFSIFTKLVVLNE